MTDPLGPAQVIPYLLGLAKQGHKLTLVSCEKPRRQKANGAAIGRLLSENEIDWHPIAYHKRPPILSSVWDLEAMHRLARRLVRREGIELVHCRSYIPALVGLRLKRELGTRFVFDMRGFWADERVDGGLWNLKAPHYRLVYNYFKKKELEFLAAADRIVSLTHAGKTEMLRWKVAPGTDERIDVIPCCVDLAHFDRARIKDAERARVRAELALTEQDYVVTYLGSLGTWYLLDEMLSFFRAVRAERPNAKLLVVTSDDPGQVRSAAQRAGIDGVADLRVVAASRNEVPVLLSLSKIGLYFIKPAYSKISSSPTKMAEFLAMGVPIVTNTGVGDIDWFASQYDAAIVMKDFGAQETARAIASLPELDRLPPSKIRLTASDCFSLESGVQAYHRIYLK